MALALFLIFFIAALVGVPIAISLLVATAVPLYIYTDMPMSLIVQRIFTSMNSFSLMAVPLFILSGALLEKGGVSKRLINFANALVGFFPGGLAIVCFVASAFFGAISGSATATVAAIGGIVVPALIKEGYSVRFSLATAASAGYLGIIIPPSIPMVTYSLATGCSVSDLFTSGFIPGVLLTVLMSVYAIIYGKKHVPITHKFSLRNLWTSFKEAIWAILMPVIILGGIYGGIFTATEAAAVACLYGFIVGLLVYRELKLKDILDIFKQSTITSSMIMFIVVAAAAFGWLMTWANIPNEIANFIISVSPNKVGFLLLVTVLLLFVGVFMDTNAAILILGPIFAVVLPTYGISPVHFGIVMIVNLAIGLLTPPVGVNLYVAAGILNVKAGEVINRHLLCYMLLSLAGLLAMIFIPDIVMFLPNLLK